MEKLKIKQISKKRNIIIKNERNVIFIPTNVAYSYILKCARRSKYFSTTLRNESWFYGWVYSNPNLSSICKFIPKFHGSFQHDQILAIENLFNFESLQMYAKKYKKFPKYLIKNMAENLAQLHSISFLEISRKMIKIPIRNPEIPMIDKITPEYLAHNEDSLLELLQILQNNVEFSLLNEFQNFQNPRCLIHGDIKFDNILKSRLKDRGLKKTIFIDWELCGLGDPEYDVGTIIANFVLQWIDSVELKDDEKVEDWQNRTKIPFTYLQNIISVFWFYYSNKILDHTKNLDVDKKLSIGYSGVVLIQYVYSKILSGYNLSSKNILSLILAKYFLTKPFATTEMFKLG